MINQHGHSIVFLPSPRLDRTSVEKATEMLGQFASNSGISNQQVRHQARQIIQDELSSRGELDRYRDWL